MPTASVEHGTRHRFPLNRYLPRNYDILRNPSFPRFIQRSACLKLDKGGGSVSIRIGIWPNPPTMVKDLPIMDAVNSVIQSQQTSVQMQVQMALMAK